MSGKKRKQPETPPPCAMFRGVSSRELHAILTEIKACPEILDDVKPKNFNLITRHGDEFEELKQTIVLPLNDGNHFHWQVLSLSKLVAMHVNKNPFFRTCFESALLTNERRQLGMILYLDELTPGNALRPDNRRKLYQWYISFVDFKLHLRNEDVWLPLALLRSSVAHQLAGGISSACNGLLQNTVDEDGSVFKGALVKLPEPTLYFASFKVYLGDEAALKAFWSVKGSAGVKPCFCCTNIIKKGSPLLDVCPDLLPITETSFSNCFATTNEDLWAAQDELARQAPALSKQGLDNLEKASGQNYCPYGVLANVSLRRHAKPLDSQFDTMHVYFSGGAAELELNLMTKALQNVAGLRCDTLQSFLNAWRSLGPTVYITLKDFEFKGMASAVLYTIPILRFFLEKHCSHEAGLTSKIASFRALHDVVSCLRTIKEAAVVPLAATRLLAALQKKHFVLFQLAYSVDEEVKPKHHFALHVPSQINRHNFLFDCFALERKHQLVKAQVNNIAQVACSQVFEGNLSVQLNRLQIDESSRTQLPPYLVAPKPTGLGFDVAKSVRLTFMIVKVKDVIYSPGGVACLVQSCCSHGHAIELLVQPFSLQEELFPKAKKWRSQESFWKLLVKDVPFCVSIRICIHIYLYMCLNSALIVVT
jgi:hypothetical protein